MTNVPQLIWGCRRSDSAGRQAWRRQQSIHADGGRPLQADVDREQGATCTSQGPACTSQGPMWISQGPTCTNQGPTCASRGPTCTSEGPMCISQGGRFQHRVDLAHAQARTTAYARACMRTGAHARAQAHASQRHMLPNPCTGTQPHPCMHDWTSGRKLAGADTDTRACGRHCGRGSGCRHRARAHSRTCAQLCSRAAARPRPSPCTLARAFFLRCTCPHFPCTHLRPLTSDQVMSENVP